jgi:uncharacterized integral membrane protein
VAETDPVQGDPVRRLSWIITLPLTVIAVLFALSNSAPTEVRLWPLPWAADLPLYLLILGFLLIGFLLGIVVAWLSGGSRRRRMRMLSEQVRAQAGEISELHRREEARMGSIGAAGLTATGLTATGLAATDRMSTGAALFPPSYSARA